MRDFGNLRKTSGRDVAWSTLATLVWFTLLLTCYLLPLTPRLQWTKCRDTPPCLQCSKPFLFILGSFLAIDKLMPCGSIVNKATGQVYRPVKTAGKKTKLSNINQNGIDYCQLNTCNYNSFATIWGLTAIDKILVAGWKHASCLSVRRFWCFLRPKLGLLYLSFCRCYIETTTNTRYWEVFPVDWCNCQSNYHR